MQLAAAGHRRGRKGLEGWGQGVCRLPGEAHKGTVARSDVAHVLLAKPTPACRQKGSRASRKWPGSKMPWAHKAHMHGWTCGLGVYSGRAADCTGLEGRNGISGDLRVQLARLTAVLSEERQGGLCAGRRALFRRLGPALKTCHMGGWPGHRGGWRRKRLQLGLEESPRFAGKQRRGQQKPSTGLPRAENDPSEK